MANSFMAMDFYLTQSTTDLMDHPMGSEESRNKANIALITASARGSLNDVTTLLGTGIDPNVYSSMKTALCEAVARGRYTCVQALLAAGADPNMTMRTDSGVSPLMIALDRNERMCVEALIEHDDIDIKLDRMDWTGKNLLMYAASAGHIRLTQFLLQKYDEGIEPLKRRDFSLDSVLTHAAINGQRSYLHELRPLMWFTVDLIKCAANDDSIGLRRLLEENEQDPNQTDYGGLTALMVCCMMDHRECLKVLIDFPIQLNKQDDTGRVAIHYAAGCGNSQCMEILIEMGASVFLATSKRESLLLIAAKSGFPNCVKVAISALLVEQDRNALSPPLHNAFSVGRCEGELLYSFEVSDFFDKTALTYACEKGFHDIVKMLLDNGVNACTSSCMSGKTALICAAVHGHARVVELLLARCAKVNAVDKSGMSALYYAASEGHLPCVLLLLQAGAEINTTATTMFTQSAPAIALDRSHTECAAAIIRAMSLRQLAMPDVRGMNWILYTIKSGNLTCLRLLFQLGMSWENRHVDNNGNTPLMYAAASSNMEIMDFIIKELGMNPDQRNAMGLNALGVAVFHDVQDPIIRYLIRNNLSVQANHKGARSCPLFYACVNGNVSHIRILLVAGADVSNKDHRGSSYIFCVVQKDNPEAVRLIFDAEKAKGILLADFVHKKAFLCAIGRGHASVVTLFLRAGIFDWSWYPHCMQHIRGRKRVLVKSLVTLGISPGVFQHNDEPSSPLGLALQYYDMAAAKYLISNSYFTSYDYANILKNMRIRKTLEYKCKENLYGDAKAAIIVAIAIYSNPLPLTALSFLQISSAIGQHCGLSARADAVETLPLPRLIKTKLAFREPVAKLCNHDWKNIALDERVHGSGWCRRVYSLFEECTRIENPLSTSSLHKCQRPHCVCGKTGLSFYEGQELQEKQQVYRREVIRFD